MFDRAKFFAGIRNSPFPGKLKQSQVDGCSFLLNEFFGRGLTDYRCLAYILATVFWECDQTMQPIKEGGGLKYLKSKRYYPWYGRGYVQLTWQANYKRMQELLGPKLPNMDLIKRPDDALNPLYATAILFEGMCRAESFKGDFTGKSLEDYFTPTKTDWIGARRIINGTDRAVEIAGIAKQFYADIMQAA